MQGDGKQRTDELRKQLRELLAASKTQLPGLSSTEGRLSKDRLPDDRDRVSSERRSSERRNSDAKLPSCSEQDGQDPVVYASQTTDPKALESASPGTSIATGGRSWIPLSQPDDRHGNGGVPEPGRGKGCLPGQLRASFRGMGVALKKHPSIWIISLALILMLMAGGVIGVMLAAKAETQQRRLSAQGDADGAAVAFEAQLEQMFEPLLALATIIRFSPNYSAVNKTFDAVAKELLDQMNAPRAVTTLIAAPQGVLSNFYPLEGYCLNRCDNININLFAEPDRREKALETVERGKLTMQGPMRLSQGYFGVVGRLPIFVQGAAPNETFGAPALAINCSICYNKTTQSQFWGFVNAVVNFETLTDNSDSRLKDLQKLSYNYLLYDTADNGTTTTIAATPTLPQDPVVSLVHAPNGLWTLEVAPEGGWVPAWRDPVLAAVVIISCLVGLLVGVVLVSRHLQLWLQTTNDALAQEKQRMDVLLARQYNLISCVLEHEGNKESKARTVQEKTLERIEQMRREIGVTTTGGVDELKLLELIDEGTFGKVYRGVWRGTDVAIKTMILPAKMSGAEKRERMAIMEAAISSAMAHPNITQTYTYTIKPTVDSRGIAISSSEASSTSGAHSRTGSEPAGGLEVPDSMAHSVHSFEVSLVLEYCDWGSLRTALDSGAFFADGNTLNYAAMLDTAIDVARAMLHLHTHSVLHSDLKARNVLLKSDGNGRRCIAKVADFGLAVKIDPQDTHISLFQGTMSHMAPEALVQGHQSKAADVYSFGITLWELFTGGHAHRGIPRALLGHKVAVLGERPAFPGFAPREFVGLAQDCWAPSPSKRPDFDQILVRLQQMREELKLLTTPPLTKYKLQPKQTLEQRERVEQLNTQEQVAEAEGAGLLQMAGLSTYVEAVHTTPGRIVAQSRASCSSSGQEGSSAPVVGFLPFRSGSFQRLLHNGVIRLQGGTMSGSKLEPIADVVDEQELKPEQSTQESQRAAAEAGDIEQGGMSDPHQQPEELAAAVACCSSSSPI